VSGIASTIPERTKSSKRIFQFYKRRLEKMDKDNDISKRTVLVLLVLTLIVSVVGTWTILSQPTTIYKTMELGGPAPGRVSLSINAPTVPQLSNEAGKVSINIMK
jgi:hypothetical protein